MTSQKSLRWRSVTGGVIAVVTIVAVTVFVLVYARSGALHGSKFRLYVAAPDADNLRSGSEVWLNGQRVGLVRAIRFNVPNVAPDVRVVIETEILSAVQRRIRLDSRASLQSGGTVIGEPVVYINAGSRAARRVVSDDTLRAGGNPDIEIATAKVATSLEQLPTLIANGKDITANARTVTARLAAMVRGDAGRVSISQLLTTARAKTTAGQGAARILSDTSLRSGVARSMADLDSLQLFLATGADQLGRFRRDSTLAHSVSELRLEIGRVRELASSTSGTLGRYGADSAARRGLDSAFLELTALVADIRKHPTRYAHVF